MAAIVIEDAIPVRYDSWTEWRTSRAVVPARAPAALPDTEFCADCWGQGIFFEPARNGEGLVRRPCACCGATGLRRTRDR